LNGRDQKPSSARIGSANTMIAVNSAPSVVCQPKREVDAQRIDPGVETGALLVNPVVEPVEAAFQPIEPVGMG